MRARQHCTGGISSGCGSASRVLRCFSRRPLLPKRRRSRIECRCLSEAEDRPYCSCSVLHNPIDFLNPYLLPRPLRRPGRHHDAACFECEGPELLMSLLS